MRLFYIQSRVRLETASWYFQQYKDPALCAPCMHAACKDTPLGKRAMFHTAARNCHLTIFYPSTCLQPDWISTQLGTQVHIECASPPAFLTTFLVLVDALQKTECIVAVSQYETLGI